MVDRTTFLRSQLDVNGKGLEIGPSYNPLMPKSEGFDVEILDHVDQAGLQKKYTADPSVDIRRIESVDHVSDGRPMTEVIGATLRYDYIVASHVIEHTPDFVSFLKDCSALLKDTGVLVLAVPDKRFCFDVLRPVTSIGDVIQAHHEKRTRHTVGTIFEHLAMVAERGGNIVWAHGSEGEVSPLYTLAEATGSLEWARNQTSYNDAHAWKFTPTSFRYIIDVLHRIQFIDLKEIMVEVPGGCEFYVTLSRSGPGCALDQTQLLRSMLDETLVA